MKKYITLGQGVKQGIGRAMRPGIMLSIIFLSIIFSVSMASAADTAYYWDRTTGVSIGGYTTNWSSCSSGSPQNGFKVTSIRNLASSCTNGALTRSTVGDMFLEIFPTTYTSDTQITGINATFYLGRPSSGTTTYRIDLGYVQAGVFTSFGYVTRALTSSSSYLATTNMNTISGTAPTGSNLALKLSVTTLSSRQTAKVNLGTNGGSTGSNSGRFYVNETVATPIQLNIAAPTDVTTVTTGTYTTVNLGTPTITGGVSPYTTTNDAPPEGFSIGITTVTWNTTDFVGAIATDTQLVTITQSPPDQVGYKIIVSSDRYSIFSPWTGKASDASLSANFTGYALLLDDNGSPVSGQSITFKIYAGSGGTILKSTKTAITQTNGLASVTYDTYGDFSSSTDVDYGTWKIEAYLTSTPTVTSNTNMKIEAGGSATPGGSGCLAYCHKTSVKSGDKPLSPYTAGYGAISSRAAAAHKKSDHINKGCYYCHPGYAAVKTGSYGNTNDVHKNRTCDYCHGTWSYISSTTAGNGNGIPKMPSCYQCHPVLNSFPSNVSTLDNLAAGNGISVYSFNFDQKKPLTAHTGTMYSLVDSVPCIVCHGPAHNNSKPLFTVGTSNSNTENEQCWTCHANRDTTHKYNTNCVGCHSQDAHNVSTAGGGSSDCKSCHDIGGSAPRHVNFNAMNSTGAVHKNLNSAASSTVNAENKKCWSCHGDGTEPVGGHPSNYLTPKVCTNCHTSGTYKVDNHIQNGTNISTETSCIDCHNNSISRFESSANASVSHYGTKTSLVNTKDCIYCHKNLTSGNLWGGATDPWNSITFPHSLSTTTNEECYSCHGDISAGTISFHNGMLMKPPLSSVTCTDCHKLGINLSETKIDSSVSSTAAHKSKNCTDCHTGATTSNMKTYSVTTSPPVICTNCHTGLEHQQSAPDVQVTISCNDCHNNGGMYTANSGTNGTENAVVHYLKDVTNTTTIPYIHTGPIDTSNCMNCHGSGGIYTGNVDWGSPVDISASSKRIHTETTIAECNNCHKDNTVTTLENVDFHNSSLVAGAGGDNCIGCHAGNE